MGTAGGVFRSATREASKYRLGVVGAEAEDGGVADHLVVLLSDQAVIFSSCLSWVVSSG
jgi:hypothetical protein